MFDWQVFSKVALSALLYDDSHLVAILSKPCPLDECVDQIGKPIADTVVIRQHPDVENFSRVMGIRRQLAERDGNWAYLAYANEVCTFLESLSKLEELFIVLIATQDGNYEFLYSPAMSRLSMAKTMV